MFIVAEGWRVRSPMKQQLVRLDRIAGELNAWLLAIAIGLGMLDLTVLVAKCLPPLPRPRNLHFSDDALGWMRGTIWPLTALIRAASC